MDRDKANSVEALPARQLSEASHDKTADSESESEAHWEAESFRVVVHEDQESAGGGERPQSTGGD